MSVPVGLRPEDFLNLARRVLQDATSGTPRPEFVRTVLDMLLNAANADAAELRIIEKTRTYRGILGRGMKLRYEQHPRSTDAPGLLVLPNDPPDIMRLTAAIAERQPEHLLLCWTDGRLDLQTGSSDLVSERIPERMATTDQGGSFVLSGFCCGAEGYGLLMMRSTKPRLLDRTAAETLENMVQILGCAIASRRVQAALRERVKELGCLYGIAMATEQSERSLDDILNDVVRLLPPAWLYSDIAEARIVLDEKEYHTKSYSPGRYHQRAEIVIGPTARGHVEVAYCTEDDLPEMDEGPFLKEERSLIDAVARELGQLVVRREAAEERVRLELQLRHADRLATIGQLAAGVAHELNEPLGSILGFAQLAAKVPGLPTQAAADIRRIVQASLHARDVVSKLMLFARQKPPAKEQVDVNQLVDESLSLLSMRCVKSGIEVVRELTPDLPLITADPAQVRQVIINLAVNAIQAMPTGGRLFIRTEMREGTLAIVVQDNGVGMTKEVKERAFVPFFTTKSPGEGTGLGLSVVHGIITGHGGTVHVWSEPGRGSRFEVLLPTGDK